MDLIAGLALGDPRSRASARSPTSDDLVSDANAQTLSALLQLIQCEAHALRGKHLAGGAVYLTQQLCKCGADLAKPALKALLGSLQRKLGAVDLPYMVRNWRSRRESMALERTLSDHEERVMAVAITPDGKRALSASYDRTLKLWNLETGKELASIYLEAGMTCVAVGNRCKSTK